MTGDEFFSLRRGDTITVETPYGKHEKGRVLKVEYIDTIHQDVYVRNVSNPLGSQISLISIISLLDNFVVGGKLSEKNNDKVLELPFKVGDEVWFIVDNEVHDGTLIKCDITINKDDTRICYNVLYHNRTNCIAKGIASSKLFKTKEELLKSL